MRRSSVSRTWSRTLQYSMAATLQPFARSLQNPAGLGWIAASETRHQACCRAIAPCLEPVCPVPQHCRRCRCHRACATRRSHHVTGGAAHLLRNGAEQADTQTEAMVQLVPRLCARQLRLVIPQRQQHRLRRRPPLRLLSACNVRVNSSIGTKRGEARSNGMSHTSRLGGRKLWLRASLPCPTR